MKIVFIGGLWTLLIMGIGHFMIKFLNHDLYQNRKAYHEAVTERSYPNLRRERLKLQLDQKKSLDAYKWLNKRNGYVQIPIERAFDYYLRGHAE